ncbi:MAG: hypothetical protein ACRDBG_10020 [Waterburya sp.]
MTYSCLLVKLLELSKEKEISKLRTRDGTWDEFFTTLNDYTNNPDTFVFRFPCDLGYCKQYTGTIFETLNSVEPDESLHFINLRTQEVLFVGRDGKWEKNS